MPHIVHLPPLGQTFEEAKVLEWLLKSGDTVEKGEPVLIVEIDKATLEINSDVNGRITRLLAEPGATVRVGDPVVEIET
jgi:pyruvate dehydrogenase E2 component (dihydrolipoamide acetyltransferase)